MTYPNELLRKAQNTKLMLFDIDGVFTNGQIWLNGDGEEYKLFNTQDGYGIKHLQRNGVIVGVISGRKSAACERRMQELSVEHVYQGIHEKMPVFRDLLINLALKPEQCGYVGDDVPDMPVMREVGLKVAVANATEQVKALADWTTIREGGHGAVRDVCDLITHAQTLETHYVT